MPNFLNAEQCARVAILGTGKIGLDLLFKVKRSPLLSCVLVAGRNAESAGLSLARDHGINISDQGINSIMEMSGSIDILFDATSALAHIHHWELLKSTKIKVIDLTPSKIERPIVPAVNLVDADSINHVNMISCGGQSSIPIVNAISEAAGNFEYAEVVSSIASKSAGAATRVNIDEYIHTTERGILSFSKASRSKVILILNPAEPPISMQTSISCQIDNPPMDKIIDAVRRRVKVIQDYVPGYELLIEPKQIERNRVITMVKVVGLGDFLPKYAGNLDIINSAAIAVAERMAQKMPSFASTHAPRH